MAVWTHACSLPVLQPWQVQTTTFCNSRNLYAGEPHLEGGCMLEVRTARPEGLACYIHCSVSYGALQRGIMPCDAACCWQEPAGSNSVDQRAGARPWPKNPCKISLTARPNRLQRNLRVLRREAYAFCLPGDGPLLQPVPATSGPQPTLLHSGWTPCAPAATTHKT